MKFCCTVFIYFSKWEGKGSAEGQTKWKFELPPVCVRHHGFKLSGTNVQSRQTEAELTFDSLISRSRYAVQLLDS
ncbi:hypothetical protein MTR67_050347 [Solanum verrucosum]|uniref:Uncharacterized protein n=1 Tax=Solanum verrucosum TaxID=315347 RepID=A0AAF0V293_SOLVR|nr:hypothetical protein MTR67_050347 [Solanum verrucosum]